MQIIINGFIYGLAISLLALGFSIVYVPTRVFHIAIGGIYAATPFFVIACVRLGCHPFAAVMVAILAGVILSFLCEWLNHYPLEHRQASDGVHLVSSLGIYIIIVQVVSLVWGDDVRVLRTGIGSVYKFGDVVITQSQVIGGIYSLILVLCFYAWLRFTRIGLHFRGLASNPREFVLRGHNIQRFRLLAFGMSGALAASSALVISYDVGFDPHVGFWAVLQAIVAVVIGGRDSLLGPILGGVLLGLVHSHVLWFFSGRWEAASTFLVLIIILYARPEGLLGRRTSLGSVQ